jgi:sigma-70, region 4
MATINYKFADGHTETIEVTEEFAAGYKQLQDEETRDKEHEKKRRRKTKTLSLEHLMEKGKDFPDPKAVDPLKALIEKEQNEITLLSLADFLTDRQKEVMTLYYEQGYTKTETARKLAIDESAVRHHLKQAAKKILKNF